MIRRARRYSFEELEARRVLATFTVSNLLDGPVSSAGDLPGSLRQAVFDANATEGADDIEFEIDEGEIVLSGSPLLVTDHLAINGPGHSLAVSGNSETRVFVIDDGDNSGNFQFHLRDVTVREGRSVSIGGGLLSREDLFLDGVVFENNEAGDSGGGVFAEVGFTPDTEINITDVEFRMNMASKKGGGLYVDNFSEGRVTISSTRFQSNETTERQPGPPQGGGGAFIQNLGIVDVQNSSSFHSNRGGGLNLLQEQDGRTTLTETEFKDNECGPIQIYLRGAAALSVFGGTIDASALMFEGNRCGAFDATRQAHARISQSEFLANQGGAIVTDDEHVELDVTDVQFVANLTNFFGGAIRCDRCELIVRDSEFRENESNRDGGAIFMTRDGSVEIRNSTFHKNTANTGGALFLRGQNILVETSEFVENESGDLGGALNITDITGPATIKNSLFVRNNAGSSGGAMYGRAGARSITIKNSTLSQNTAVRNGGGIYFDIDREEGSGRIENSTIVENVADSLNDFAGVGGGIYVDGGSIGEVSVKNSIVAKNLYSGVGVEFDLGGLFQTIDVQHSLLGIDPGAQVTNSIQGSFDSPLDPELEPLADNGGPTATHALLPGSPAIDAGDPAFEGLEFDQRRAPFARIVNGRVDIGAFESAAAVQPPFLGGDANMDGAVDFSDFLVLSTNFGATDAVWEEGDFDDDGMVGFADFLILSINFGQIDRAD